MEEHRSHVVQMAVEREETSPSLVAPDLDLVIVSSGHEQRLSLVEIDTPDRAIMLLEAIDQSSHAVVP